MSKSSKKKQSVATSTQESTDIAQPVPTSSGSGKISFKVKTPEERKKAHKEGIVKTAVAAIIGIIAGILAYIQLGISDDPAMKWYAIMIIIAALSYYAMKLVFPLFKIRTKEFGFKDWFYVEFIVIDFCLVTWTLLLN
ncbi:EMC6-like membrane protein [Methanolobus psychrotolerans]|uniref:EMC6-like membrane protein n=1 Tax=Methanolobus psychrotolerans TaxID=1874706 RepID=UPI000B9195C5|nr:hypothetical protein [Methanolobus psychrotolerans]